MRCFPVSTKRSRDAWRPPTDASSLYLQIRDKEADRRSRTPKRSESCSRRQLRRRPFRNASSSPRSSDMSVQLGSSPTRARRRSDQSRARRSSTRRSTLTTTLATPVRATGQRSRTSSFRPRLESLSISARVYRIPTRAFAVIAVDRNPSTRSHDYSHAKVEYRLAWKFRTIATCARARVEVTTSCGALHAWTSPSTMIIGGHSSRTVCRRVIETCALSRCHTRSCSHLWRGGHFVHPIARGASRN